MSKFKNFGLGIAGTTPDLTRSISSFSSSIASDIIGSTNQMVKLIQKEGARYRAEQKKIKDDIMSASDRVTQPSIDAEVDKIANSSANVINSTWQNKKTITAEESDIVINKLDGIDVFKDITIRLHNDPVMKQFDTEVAWENISTEGMNMIKDFSQYNYSFNSSDPKKREYIFNDQAIGSKINDVQFRKLLVSRDINSINVVQSMVNNYEDTKKNSQFNRSYFDTDLTATLQNSKHLGAQLITTTHLPSLGGETIKSRLEANPEVILQYLGEDTDINGDNIVDKNQIDYIKKNYNEFVNALTLVDNENYSESVSNDFAKNFILNTSEVNFKNRELEDKLNEPGFTIENFFDNTTTTARTLGNISRTIQNLSVGNLKDANLYARNLGYVIRGVGNDGSIDDNLRAGAPTYQIFKRKVDMREEIDDGESGKMQNPDFRRPKAGEAVSKKFTLDDQDALAKQFQILISESQGRGFSSSDLNQFYKFLNRPGNENFLFENPVMDFSFNKNKNK